MMSALVALILGFLSGTTMVTGAIPLKAPPALATALPKTPGEWKAYCAANGVETGRVTLFERLPNSRFKIVHIFACATKPVLTPTGKWMLVDFSVDVPESHGQPLVLMISGEAITDYMLDDMI